MCDSTGHDDPTTYDQPAFVVERTDPLTLRASGRTTFPNPDPAIFGTGQGIKIGSQVVVAGHGMGTVVPCPSDIHDASLGIAVQIEGDSRDEAICFPPELVTLYADIYAGLDANGAELGVG